MLSNNKFSFDSVESKNLFFKVEMTHRQFASLAHKLNNADIENEIINLNFFNDRLEQGKNIDLIEVEKWLKNSWNTENVLGHNRITIENTGLSFSMQWAFPQAYYSVYGSLLAQFKSLGYTQESHTAVLKHFGDLLEQNKYPESVSFFCKGNKLKYEYFNIIKPSDLISIDFNLEREETISNQICQFLKSTRELKLEDKASDLKFKTKKGNKRKKLNPAMWNQVSSSVGNTTILDLLYRKRIKANYQDIDTFSSNQFKGIEVLENLCSIVNRLNLINEIYVAKAIGLEVYKSMLDRHLAKIDNVTVKNRFLTVENIIKATMKT